MATVKRKPTLKQLQAENTLLKEQISKLEKAAKDDKARIETLYSLQRGFEQEIEQINIAFDLLPGEIPREIETPACYGKTKLSISTRLTLCLANRPGDVQLFLRNQGDK